MNTLNFMKKTKGLQRPFEKYLFPLLLLFYPFLGVNQGVDIADTTYSLGNFLFRDRLDQMWMLATYLPNVVGHSLSRLPGGTTMLGMNIYTTLFISLTALLAYYLLQRFIPGWMIFLGEFLAISLCWCPHVILYNYMTYLFFTLGTLLLLYGLLVNDNKWFFIAAGFSLGLNVMVRFPNVLEAGLILVVWFYGYLTGKEQKKWTGHAWQQTGYSILGYVFGAALPMAFIIATYGITAYGEMIGSLLGMTGGASDYTAGGMLASIISAYGHTLSWMVWLLVCIGGGFVLFILLPEKAGVIKKILYLCGIAVIFKYLFSRGYFTRNYYYYDSMFQPAMAFLILTICLCVFTMGGGMHASTEERALALTALLILLITPLGSNNYTYPVLNNLFLIAPISLWLMRRFITWTGAVYRHTYRFVWLALGNVLMLFLFLQSVLFHVNYAFGDGDDGTVRDTVITSVSRAQSMVTTAENAASLTQLYRFLEEQNLQGRDTIQFGNAPGVIYLCELEPAIFTLWPDLDSNTVEKFDEALTEVGLLANSREDGVLAADSTKTVGDEQYTLPLIIVYRDFAGEAAAEAKYDILLDYMNNYGYNNIFSNDEYQVYQAD